MRFSTAFVSLVLACSIAGTAHLSAQSEVRDIAWVDSVLQIVRTDQNLDSRIKSELADSAYLVAHILNDTCRQVYARIVQATHLDNLGMPDSALSLLYWANSIYDGRCDSATLMLLHVNLTNVYLSLGEFDRVDSVSNLLLSLWNTQWEERSPRFAVLNNLAIAKVSVGNISEATRIFRQVYLEAREINDIKFIQQGLINLGSIKGMTEDLDSAFYFFNEAAVRAREQADVENLMPLLINLANLDKDRGRYDRAQIMLDSAFALASAQQSLHTLAAVQNARADLNAKRGDFKEAYTYLREYTDVREEYLNAERVKSVTEMMEKYASEKKARQIQQLELDKLDAQLENERITGGRNLLLYIGIVVVLIALGLWNRLRLVRRSRSEVQREKDISDKLLLNILPGSVADELKLKGYADARHFKSASILFSDFEKFTALSEQMTAAELVEELNVCFKAFDEIMMRFGIEKIKTIGDAYMSAAGIPDTNSATTKDLVRAALEMQNFVISRKRERDATGLPAFVMRAGIHTGPVVAGIVGVRKFQYDLWGDTVNIASRMQSSGETNRVNISESTYQLICDDPAFVCTPRGMVEAKGKGRLQMYFVELAPD